MLEQENQDVGLSKDSKAGFDAYVTKVKKLVALEEEIDIHKDLYFITWAPDPAHLPECEFELQHRYNVNTVIDFLRNCSAGAMCVEATQMGNPHYHGWYQICSKHERGRLAVVKTFQHFGIVKITKCKHPETIKIGWFYEKGNCLYYYRKDCTESMLWIDHNPIGAYDDKEDLVLSEHMVFFTKGFQPKKAQTIENAVSNRKFMQEFYYSGYM